MAIVAQSIQNRREAEKLISEAHRVLKIVNERPGYQDRDQMMADLQTVAALSTLATAHIAMAEYLRV